MNTNPKPHTIPAEDECMDLCCLYHAALEVIRIYQEALPGSDPLTLIRERDIARKEVERLRSIVDVLELGRVFDPDKRKDV